MPLSKYESGPKITEFTSLYYSEFCSIYVPHCQFDFDKILCVHTLQPYLGISVKIVVQKCIVTCKQKVP
jgi:hypothetical protein